MDDTGEMWTGDEFNGVSSNLHRQESEEGVGLRPNDKLGSFRTTAEFLLVSRKPRMIPWLTGSP